ncbi:MAG: chemotaxis protein MotC [Rhizobiaceae bacterium]|nr:chemotaxis protein MotC [Rhizobiaceae bacterium]
MAAVLASVASVLAASNVSAELAPLEPYQMVRSLQLVQDRIADGDHAAIPMQRKLIELIDERLRSTNSADYDDKRNYRALLIYAMSGGNPRTVEAIVRGLSPEGEDAQLSAGILHYLRGNPGEATTSLKDVDPRNVASEVSAFLALVKGSIAANDDPEQSLVFLDLARVMGPGTLIEEAALRRSAALTISQRKPGEFLSISEQYVRRFLRSPYASQFADAFVEGVAELQGSIDLDVVADIIGAMSLEQGKVIYLRLARRAAIDQQSELLVFARHGLEKMAAEVGSESDPRAILYSTVAAVTTDDVDAVRARLEAIDRRRLSAGDRMLLDAALRIVDEVTSMPAVATHEPMVNEPAASEHGSTESGSRARTADARRADDTSAQNAAFVGDVRKQLESIDQMLQETGR